MRRNIGKQQKPRVGSQSSTPLKVTVYDISAMLPVRQDLALHYTVTSDPVLMCGHNYEVALEYGNTELAHIWQLVGQVIAAAREVGNNPETGPWSR